MLNLFKSKPLLSADDAHFQLETYKWLLQNFGGDAFDKTELILPTRDYFPAPLQSADQVAFETFQKVKSYAGLSDWPCQLQAQENDIDPLVAPTLAVQNTPTNPMGTFQTTHDNEVIITYNPSLTTKPVQLVATFAHELSHYLTATAKQPPPGGWENWEFATDIAATFLGFGIFMANSAFTFEQHASADAQGWHTSRSGYLSENEHCYALAIFLMLKGIEVDAAARHLKPSLKKRLKKAMKVLTKNGVVEQINTLIS